MFLQSYLKAKLFSFQTFTPTKYPHLTYTMCSIPHIPTQRYVHRTNEHQVHFGWIMCSSNGRVCVNPSLTLLVKRALTLTSDLIVDLLQQQKHTMSYQLTLYSETFSKFPFPSFLIISPNIPSVSGDHHHFSCLSPKSTPACSHTEGESVWHFKAVINRDDNSPAGIVQLADNAVGSSWCVLSNTIPDIRRTWERPWTLALIPGFVNEWRGNNWCFPCFPQVPITRRTSPSPAR